MPNRSIANEIDELAVGQLGLVTRAQLLGRGWSISQIEYQVRRGALLPERRAVYRAAGTPRSASVGLLAVCLSANGVTAVSHRAGARAWGLSHSGPDLEVVSTCRIRLPGVVAHQDPTLTHAEVDWSRTVPITRPERTLVDLAAVCEPRQIEAHLEELLVRRLITVAEVQRALRRRPSQGRPGLAALARLVEERPLGQQRAESVLEAEFARLCIDAGLELPEFQLEVRVGGRLFRLDYAYPTIRVAIELDGFIAHGRRSNFYADSERTNLLTAVGWVVLRFTARDLRQRPEWVVETVLGTAQHRVAHAEVTSRAVPL